MRKTYSAVANVGCITNTLAQLLLALNASLPSLDNSGCAEILQASLQAVGAAASECGRSLGFLTQLRKQVWLAQTLLPESGKNILRQLPLVLGQVFGAQAQEVLDRCLLASEMRSKHLRRQATFRHPAEYFQYSHRDNYPHQQRGSGFGQSRMQEVLAPPRQPRAVSRFNVLSRCNFTSRAQPATSSGALQRRTWGYTVGGGLFPFSTLEVLEGNNSRYSAQRKWVHPLWKVTF